MQLSCARTDQRTGMRRIGPDGGACARSAGGIVHLYMTTSGGRVSRQMARDLSINGKRGEGVLENCTFTRTRISKTQFLN